MQVYSDEQSNFQGLFFQDKIMKEVFKAYPELIFVDATDKLLNLGFLTFLILSEDSNGESEISTVCLLASEDGDSIKCMFDTFKQHNDRWEATRVVMADKDLKERDIIKQCLPNAIVLICLFHTLRTFRREVSCEKLGISSGQRTVCLELLQKMAYAATDDEYTKLYAQFQTSTPKEVLNCFNESWHLIKSEWVLGLKSLCGSFLNATNNRLECINGKLKQVINHYSTLEDFISKFFIILSALRTESDHKTAVIFQKVKVLPFQQGTAEFDYTKYLTSYAAGFVLKQLEVVSKVKDIKDDGSGQCYKVQTSAGKVQVSEFDCGCIFHQSMLLPCRHMFALRKMLGKPLYDPKICDNRWTFAYYQSTQRIFVSSSSSSSLAITVSKSKDVRKLSQHEKYRKAVVLTSELASVASVASSVHFQRRIKLLKKLIDHWKNGEEVSLVEVGEGNPSFYVKMLLFFV